MAVQKRLSGVHTVDVSFRWYRLTTEAREIFEASIRGDIDTLKSSLKGCPSSIELHLQADTMGWTALHWALNRDTAQVLVESVEPDRLQEFLWASDEQLRQTALDVAVRYDRADVIEYLCGLAIADESLLDGHTLLGYTPLLAANSAQIARILVESVPTDKLTTLLLYAEEDKQTALHKAVRYNFGELVEYLCGLSSTEQILHQDGEGNIALHFAKTRECAQLLVESLPESMRKEFVCTRNKFMRTPFHNTLQSKIVDISVPKYCLNVLPCADDLLYITDKSGRTALHNVQTEEIASLLIAAVQNKFTYINITDNEGKTALHCARTKGIASLLIDAAENKSTYINIADNEGKTALHYACTEEIASLLIGTAHDNLAYISVTDNEGNTAVMSMTERGAIEALRFILESVDFEDLDSLLLMTNKKKQHVFHLACISPLVEELYELLEEYLDYLKMEDLFTADIYKNSPFAYLIARFRTRIFAQFVLKISLRHRRALLLQKNYKRTSCLSIAERKQFDSEFYVKHVLCNSGNVTHWALFGQAVDSNMSSKSDSSLSSLHNSILFPERYIKYDEDIYKVMLYALNVYSMQELHFSTHSAVAGGASSVPGYDRERTDGRSKNSLPPPILLYFDVDSLSLEEIQKQLYELDVPARHSGLKVIVVRCSTSDLVRHLSPPGPDFIIITLVSVHSDCDMLSDLQTKSFKGIAGLVDYLKSKEGVKYININSTMAKNYGKLHSRRFEDVMLSSRVGKGKALIIHNTTDRPKWEVEQEHACHVLGEQLGLQVECLYDKSADEMLTAISDFSKSSGHGSLAALSIMSHGDMADNICGDGGRGLCSVQQVVDALCQPDIQSATKLMFLNFCRGPINNPVNRTNESWECTDLKGIAQLFAFNPIKGHVTQDRLDSVRQSHPFPSVDVPVNCYICYSTLPDTKSLLYNPRTGQTNKMFDCLSAHLINICKYDAPYKRADSTGTFSDGTDSDSDDEVHAVGVSALKMNISSSEQEAAVSTKQKLPRVELIPLLLDVTGIVREKSKFTEYMNLCYAIDKDSKPLVVEVLPANKQ